MRLTAGDRLGPHEILGPLGSGGMGEVYIARDTRLDRRVALKLLPSRMSRDPEAIGRFRREAFTLAALNHPNIATIYGFEELTDDDTAVLVMELVEGETLSEQIARGAMAVERALQVCAQITEALEVAHEHGVIHRDVKPGNVMIGPRGLVKVLDFGLARRANDDRHVVAKQETPPVVVTKAVTRLESDSLQGMIVGTPAYMSPEQVLAGAVDARSDVFALGSVLYECLTGRRAFTGATEDDILFATLSAPVDLGALPEAVPARIRVLVTQCLEKDPDARPADMRAVRIELEQALGIRRAAALRERTAYQTPNNLRPPTSSFVGRHGILRDCDQRLEHTRLLTLLGMGGSGKTRVAQRIGEGALDRFPDGVWFVDLAPVTDNDHVSDVAAAALDVEDEPGRSSLESLVHHVGDLRMLFIVDNCEDVLEGARRLVAGILAGCPGSRVITTSREALGIEGETVFPLPTLAIPETTVADPSVLLDVESVRLFVERARASQPDFDLTAANAADVVSICRRLDGVPLALELAAARVQLLSVSQIRARLGDRFKLLARQGGAGPSRHQTVLATIQWSWDHLRAPERDLMRRLAVFTGGWTLELGTAVTSDSGDEFDVLDLLTRLVERSLVVVERQPSIPTRYRFLESVWSFARNELAAHDDLDRMLERHLDAYLSYAKSASVAMTGPTAVQQIAELKPEEENVLAALAWCEHAPNGPRRGLVLAERMSRFWSVLGRHAFGRRVMEEALRRDAANPPSPERARLLTRAAGFTLMVADNESARRLLEESLAFWRSSEDRSGLPTVLGGLGVVAMAQARYEDARTFGEESLEIYEKQGQMRGVAMALHNLATIEWILGRGDHGLARFERALTLLREIGDHSTETLCLSAVAMARRRCGDVVGAHQAIRECFDRLKALEAPREGLFALEAFAELLADERAVAAARFIGATEASRAALQFPRMPAEQAEVDNLCARLRTAIGPEEFARATASGSSMTLAQSLAEASRVLDSIGPSSS